MAIIDFFDRGWRINPKGAAYIQDDRRYSFDEVGELSCRIANGLLAAGFGHGDQGRRLGRQRRHRLDLHARACGARTWPGFRSARATRPTRTTTSSTPSTAKCCSSRRTSRRSIAALRPQLPKIRLWICIDGELPEVRAPLAGEPGSKDQPATRPERGRRSGRRGRCCRATGGTTGMPKGVMNTHRSAQTFCRPLHDRLPLRAPTSKPVNLAAAPMTHTAGAAVAAVHGARRHGGRR